MSMRFAQWLEAMRTEMDFASGEMIVIKRVNADIVEVGYVPEARGHLWIRPAACPGLWQVQTTHAPGWGALLYEVAIEWATAQGGGLISDRRNVSTAAENVWQKFMLRSDVGKVAIGPECAPKKSLVGRDFAQVALTRPPTTMKRLQVMGALRIEV